MLAALSSFARRIRDQSFRRFSDPEPNAVSLVIAGISARARLLPREMRCSITGPALKNLGMNLDRLIQGHIHNATPFTKQSYRPRY
jgi:hypothetical protein